MYIAKVFFFLALVVLCFGNDRDLYHSFLTKYNKHYRVGGREYAFRFEIFKANLRLIEKENAKNTGVTLGITKFADITNEEFRALKKGKFVNPTLPRMGIDDVALPATFNWVNHGVVGPVVDEGDCGSSFVFTVVESISSIYSISKNSSYVDLGTEQVESCSTTGCSGGDYEEVLEYVEDYGLEFNFQNGTCPKGKVTDGVCIKGSACVAKGNEAALAAALIAQGPLFIAIDGSQESFELYTSGVYAPTGCSSTQLDTSLLLVGYNQEAWICQNQWGEDWGMDGYIWIARNKDNMCGIATAACYPTGVAEC